ncbi:hypothetical protein L6452_22394 [Arctium lappa]|uniref:Uncharacterized protein n=1 Tax=Arctium lappa TaxID=4217 RepID=A0ACB9AZ28_ARCLA|nr:hypothetical protein L6452_22394 [Arctium lappa]
MISYQSCRASDCLTLQNHPTHTSSVLSPLGTDQFGLVFYFEKDCVQTGIHRRGDHSALIWSRLAFIGYINMPL